MEDSLRSRTASRTAILPGTSRQLTKIWATSSDALACMCFTVWYTITWIVVLSTQQNLMDCIEKNIFLKDWFKCNTEEKDINDSWTVFEFMSTGVAETATLAHLLLTLPAKAGGAEAVLHFRAYMVVFIIGTAGCTRCSL